LDAAGVPRALRLLRGGHRGVHVREVRGDREADLEVARGVTALEEDAVRRRPDDEAAVDEISASAGGLHASSDTVPEAAAAEGSFKARTSVPSRGARALSSSGRGVLARWLRR